MSAPVQAGLSDAQIDDMAFGYAPSGKIGELRAFARAAIEQHVSATPGGFPDGWVSLSIEFDQDGPEEVAYGPKRMMDKLGRQLEEYLAWKIAAARTPAAPVADAKPPMPIDQQMARWAIDGAISKGRMGTDKPPTDDHWLMEYWQIGRQLAKLGETSAWDNVTPAQAAPVADLHAASLASIREFGDQKLIDDVRTGRVSVQAAAELVASHAPSVPVLSVPADDDAAYETNLCYDKRKAFEAAARLDAEATIQQPEYNAYSPSYRELLVSDFFGYGWDAAIAKYAAPKESDNVR